jgi:polysaccharide export outer membrane protein
LPGMGSIKAVNRTLDDVQNEVHKLLIKKGLLPSFQLELTGFKSKKVYFIEKKNGSITVPLGNTKITLKELIINSRQEVTSADSLIVITLTRNEEVFRMTWDQIFDPGAPDIWIRDQDQVELESLSYKPGQVFALSGAGNAKMVPIDPSNRETLADILFTEDGALSNVLAKRSEVYLLRGRNPSVAYHLDAQNVSRILVAAKTELRPDDIVFVADRPIVSFARALGELSPLQMLLRDIRTNNLP